MILGICNKYTFSVCVNDVYQVAFRRIWWYRKTHKQFYILRVLVRCRPFPKACSTFRRFRWQLVVWKWFGMFFRSFLRTLLLERDWIVWRKCNGTFLHFCEYLTEKRLILEFTITFPEITIRESHSHSKMGSFWRVLTVSSFSTQHNPVSGSSTQPLKSTPPTGGASPSSCLPWRPLRRRPPRLPPCLRPWRPLARMRSPAAKEPKMANKRQIYNSSNGKG